MCTCPGTPAPGGSHPAQARAAQTCSALTSLPMQSSLLGLGRILMPTWVPSSVLALPPHYSPKDLGTSMHAARRETWASGPGPPVHGSLLL